MLIGRNVDRFIKCSILAFYYRIAHIAKHCHIIYATAFLIVAQALANILVSGSNTEECDQCIQTNFESFQSSLLIHRPQCGMYVMQFCSLFSFNRCKHFSAC